MIEAIIYLLEHPEAEAKDLMRYVKGPDFPTGGIICGRGGIKDAYNTGRGKLTVRAKAAVEHQKERQGYDRDYRDTLSGAKGRPG